MEVGSHIFQCVKKEQERDYDLILNQQTDPLYNTN